MAAYYVGRHHHGRLDYDRAIASYREALQADPTNTGARNGLGILYSATGRHDDAIRELKAAVALMPHEAYLHNNLGYAHLLAGAAAEAAKEFEEATRLDPRNRRAAENLRLARTRLGALDAAPAAPQSANASSPPVDTPAALAGRANVPDPLAAVSGLVQVAPQIYEILPAGLAAESAARQPEPGRAKPESRPAAQPATPEHRPPTSAPPAGPLRTVRLEVSNGNGVNGFARKVATALHRIGWGNSRLTNQPSYSQPATEIHYRPGHIQDAMLLAATLKPGILVIRSDALTARIDVRLVLGQDARTEMALLHRDPAGNGAERIAALPGK